MNIDFLGGKKLLFEEASAFVSVIVELRISHIF